MAKQGRPKKKVAPKKIIKNTLPVNENVLCKKCGVSNPPKSVKCKNCGHTKFLPPWVKEFRKINRAVSVEITQSNPKEGEKQNRISLKKWVFGIKPQNFNITSPEQWDQIKAIIDEDLAPKIGWKAKQALVKAVKEELQKPKQKKTDNSGVMELVEQYPQFSGQFLDKISEILKDADFEKVQELLEHVANATSSYDAVFFSSLKAVFEKLKGEDSTSLVTFGNLLKEWNLKQITDVTKEVKRRLAELNLFIEKIQDEKTYEIRGENSIHRILERSMWLIDERYWIIQSNQQLRTFIGEELEKEDKKFKSNRPDFACGTYDGTTVIIEIKRPSHKLGVDDLNQLEKYLRLSKKYIGGKNPRFKAILIGNAKSNELDETLEFRTGTEVWTYNELVQDCKKRYNEFLKHMQKSNA